VSDLAPPQISLIVAMAENGVIGRDGDLPWRISSDLKLFRQLTMGKPLIMGRKTFSSLKKPLDGRDTIVVTRNPAFTADGAIVVHSLDKALAAARDFALRRGVDELFVIGGAELFRQALPLASRLYLTRIAAEIPGDVTFPPLDCSEWLTISSKSYEKGPKDPFAFTFSINERISTPPATV
jgi:dihydrofolate reductase